MEETMRDKIKKLEEKRIHLQQGGGPKAIQRQHGLGKLTARERIAKLLDPESFIEFDLWAAARKTGYDIDDREMPADGVITGYGTVGGRPVCIYAQDFTILAGTLGTTHAKKIIKVLQRALKMEVPLIGIVDSGGVRVQDHVTANPHDAYSTMFYYHTISSGVIPQIALMMGPCAAGASYSPILHDLVLMVKKTSHMYIASPALVKTVTSEVITDQELGGAEVHAKISGCCDVLTDNDEDCLERAKKLLSFLPLNNKEKPPRLETGDDPNRRDEELLDIVPLNSKVPFDMHKIIQHVVDKGDFFEIKKEFAKNMIVGLARLNGQPVGIVANNPAHIAGSLDINGADKEARFIRFCDCFNIPLVFFVDTPAYLPGKAQEHGGIIRHGAKVLYAISEATVPKMTVYIRKAYGGANPAMCNEPMGSDLLLAWPTAEAALMGAEGAVAIIYGKEISTAQNPSEMRQKKMEEYLSQFGEQPYHAAAFMRLEEIIDPRDTRPLLIKALRMMDHKKENRKPKKHGNIPL
ncbi:MAG: acyl-CoA carboxylase subunit beta [Thermodesulfobacteriota bacterium]|nr:acyl-CoA carboxylase subunit beta [Thermodesulfobacteriota bacterium]